MEEDGVEAEEAGVGERCDGDVAAGCTGLVAV